MPAAKRTTGGVAGGLLSLVGLSALAGVLVTATVTPAIAVTGYTASGALTLFKNLPNDLRIDTPMEPSRIWAKNEDGSDFELTSFYDQNRTPVERDRISDHMEHALLSSEDSRYYEHGGIDLLGTMKAFLDNLEDDGNTRGGSSITQQYVKNVIVQRCEKEAQFGTDEHEACFDGATASEGTQGYQRKLQEVRYAITLEEQYDKEDILVAYLNLANFGGRTYGVEAAAQRYFDTSAADLSIGQAATLAGMVQNPNRFRIDIPSGADEDAQGNPINGEHDGYELTRDRRDYVLDEMLDNGYITKDEHTQFTDAPIEPTITTPKTGCQAAGGSAYFCKYVQETLLNDTALGETQEERWDTLRRGGLDIYTTLDFRVQMPAEAAMTEYAAPHIDGVDFGAAGVTLEPSTGRILAIVQNTRFSEDEEEVASDPALSTLVYAGDYDHGKARGFNAGSTYKLFTLVDWLEKGRSINEVVNGAIRAYNWTCDGTLNYNNVVVNNFDQQRGRTDSVLAFTRDSLNTGYLAMASQLDVCEINDVAARMGVTYGDMHPVTDRNWEGDNRGPALFDVLGSKNVSPVAMASAYATIAKGGIRCQPHAIDRIVDVNGEELPVPETGCEQVVEPNVAATAARALSSVMVGGGTGARANPGDGTPLIGKTGTHEDTQTWMIESSTAATTAAWVGFTEEDLEDPRRIKDQSSNGYAADNIRYFLANDIQAAANAAYPGGPFPEPDANLTRQIFDELPNVVGESIERATAILEEAGFGVAVGEPVMGDQAKGSVQTQDPNGSEAPRGSVVTIRPSDGAGGRIPDVQGMSVRAAFAAIQAAGFKNVTQGHCETVVGAGSGRATGTTPGAGTVAEHGTQVKVDYESESCR